MMEVVLRGDTFSLLPERMIWWPGTKTLLVADLHFGKGAVFRGAGIPVPGGTTAKMCHKLTRLIEHYRADRLIVLGDLVHAQPTADRAYQEDLLEWRSQHRQLSLVLTRGNHDRGHRELFERLAFAAIVDRLIEPPFQFQHDGAKESDLGHFVFGGHLHPATRMYDTYKSSVIVACFVLAQSTCTLPAFGEFTGVKLERTSSARRLLGVVGDEIIEVL